MSLVVVWKAEEGKRKEDVERTRERKSQRSLREKERERER